MYHFSIPRQRYLTIGNRRHLPRYQCCVKYNRIIPIIPFALYFDLNNFGQIDYIHIFIIFYGIFLSSAYTYWAYFTILQNFSVNVTSISVMAVPILAILVDYIFVGVKFSGFDLLAVIFIVSGIYIVATKPFNKQRN